MKKNEKIMSDVFLFFLFGPGRSWGPHGDTLVILLKKGKNRTFFFHFVSFLSKKGKIRPKKVKTSQKNWEKIFDKICIQTPRLEKKSKISKKLEKSVSDAISYKNNSKTN